jgi:O-antigen ligase
MLVSKRAAFRRNPGLVHVLIVGILSFSVYALFVQSSGTLIQGLGKDPTMSGRTVGWPIILSYATNPLVGAGYESFWLGERLEKVRANFPGLPIGQAHNGYIEMYLILGWIGVALLGLLIATGYRNVTGAYRRDPDIGSLRIAYFLAVVVNGFTEGIFRMMAVPWIFFLLATAAAPWMPRRSAPAVLTSTQHLPESGQEPDAVRDGVAARY